MDTLTLRAERALLGAMLEDPGLVRALDGLSRDDFTLPAHTLVYRALTGWAEHWSVPDQKWAQTIAWTVRPEVPAGYLAELRRACPEPLHGRAYAAMVLMASTRRMLAGHAKQLDETADEITYQAQRQAGAGGAGAIATASHAQHMSEIAHAIRRHTAVFDPDTIAMTAGPPLARVGNRVHEEETILAALLRGHTDTALVLRSLPEEAFSHPLRREIFRTIATLYAGGKAVDALCVDWELAQDSQPGASRPGYEPDAGDGPGYTARLATIDAGQVEIAWTVSALSDRLKTASAGRGSSAKEALAGRVAITDVPALPGGVAAYPGVLSDQRGPRLIQSPPDAPDPGQDRTHRM